MRRGESADREHLNERARAQFYDEITKTVERVNAVVDRMVLFMAPAVLGGDGVPAVAALGIRRVADAVRLEGLAVARLGDDVVLEGRVRGR